MSTHIIEDIDIQQYRIKFTLNNKQTIDAYISEYCKYNETFGMNIRVNNEMYKFQYEHIKNQFITLFKGATINYTEIEEMEKKRKIIPIKLKKGQILIQKDLYETDETDETNKTKEKKKIYTENFIKLYIHTSKGVIEICLYVVHKGYYPHWYTITTPTISLAKQL